MPMTHRAVDERQRGSLVRLCGRYARWPTRERLVTRHAGQRLNTTVCARTSKFDGIKSGMPSACHSHSPCVFPPPQRSSVYSQWPFVPSSWSRSGIHQLATALQRNQGLIRDGGDLPFAFLR
jgi:hypothetical protein